MPFAASAAFKDLGALVFGHHALDLQQQLVLGRAAQLTIEKHDLDASALKLVNQQHLIGVLARKAIRRVDIEPIHAPGGDQIPQALQGGPDQGRATIALVDELTFRRKSQSILSHTGMEGGNLTGNGVGLSLLLGRHTSIAGCLRSVHIRPLLYVAWGGRVVLVSACAAGGAHAG